MRILLIGEYSNVHWGLAKGLRQLGHDVTVASDGDFWKNYQRDIDLKRHSYGFTGTVRYLFTLHKAMRSFKGFDVVQIINPMFLELRAEHILPYYQKLRKNNRSIFMGAFGMDKYWVKVGMDCHTFRYSDFNIGNTIRNNPDNAQFIAEWLNGPKGTLNDTIAEDCDGIISGLYEYDVCYKQFYPNKTRYISFPIEQTVNTISPTGEIIKFFIGIQKGRSAYKGTDIMLRALERIHTKYPNRTKIIKAESIPFAQYQHMIEECDVLLDQLYSYTPGMNGLLAMSKGIVLVGGGEEEHYELINEQELRPIVNVQPTEDSVFNELEQLVLHPDRIDKLKKESIEYIRRHHDPIKVAHQYIDFWNEVINNSTSI